MKKVLLFLIFPIIVLGILPLIGNKLIQESLEMQIEMLQTKGIALKKEEIKSSYLYTQREYQFYVKDSQKFLDYLSKYSSKQLAPYVELVVDGALVGVDLKYSNLPFMEDIELEVYLLSLSKSLENELKQDDKELYEHINRFLKERGFLYHLNYNIVTRDFDGYVKDIDESYNTNNGSNLHLKLSNVVYSGNGDLLAPKRLNSKIQTFSLKIANQFENLKLTADNVKAKLAFDSFTSYTNMFQIKTFDLNVTTQEGGLEFDADEIRVDLSSYTSSQKAILNSRSEIGSCKFNLDGELVSLEKIVQDISFEEMEKDSYERLTRDTAKFYRYESDILAQKMKDSLIELVSKGLIVKVNDLSFQDLHLQDKDLQGFSVKAQSLIRKDPNLAVSMEFMPLLALKNVDSDVEIKISKKIFSELVNIFSVVSFLKEYAKENGDDLVYEISFHNQSLKINGKGIL